MDAGRALEIWQAIYRRVLDRLRPDGEWLFLHYEQLLDGSGVDRLAAAAHASLDEALVDPGLHRSRWGGDVAGEPAATYDELRALAGLPA